MLPSAEQPTQFGYNNIISRSHTIGRYPIMRANFQGHETVPMFVAVRFRLRSRILLYTLFAYSVEQLKAWVHKILSKYKKSQTAFWILSIFLLTIFCLQFNRGQQSYSFSTNVPRFLQYKLKHVMR